MVDRVVSAEARAFRYDALSETGRVVVRCVGCRRFYLRGGVTSYAVVNEGVVVDLCGLCAPRPSESPTVSRTSAR